MGKDVNRRFTPIGQGFMLRGAGGGVIEFNNGQRGFRKEGNYSQFKMAERKDANNSYKKDPQVIPKIRLKVNINDSYTRSLSLAFWPGATKGTDAGMDAAGYTQASADVGWLQEKENYIIDVRPFDIYDEIPLFLKVGEQKSTFDFSVAEQENVNLGNIFLLDSSTGSINSIVDGSYTLDLEPGDYSSRFKLVFRSKENDVPLPVEDLIPEADQNFSVFQNNYMKELEIISDAFAPVKHVGIFDLKGKKLFFRSNFSNRRSVSISTAHWAEGIYIVKITDTEDHVTTKKIAVFNSN